MPPSYETTTQIPDSESWDRYWLSAGDAAALNVGKPVSNQLQQEWESFLQINLAKRAKCKLLDLACGNGVLTGLVSEFNKQIPDCELEICSLDSSASAITNIQKHYPQVQTVVADAAKTGLKSNDFDLVVSQFGIEYADNGATEEVERLLAPNGQLMFICHLKQGQIYQQCEADLKLVETFQQTGLMKSSREAFDCGFSVFKGQLTKAEFQPFNEAMLEAGAKAKPILNQTNATPLMNTLRAIFVDIGEMYKQLTQYDPAEAMLWFDRTEAELDAYITRMKAMLAAAMDEKEFEQFVGELTARSIEVTSATHLVANADNQAFAWIVKATARKSN